jgi:SulP family sulfate permease
MAAFAALLLVVAWNMSDARHFMHIMRVAPRSDVWVMLACFTLTVLFDMVLAISAGLMLAALLFIRRMAEVSGTALVDSAHPSLREPLPPGVLLYEISGPLFFGAAKKAMASLTAIHRDARVAILDVSRVPAIDATGLVNLESTLSSLLANGTQVVIAGLQDQPRRSLEKAGLTGSAEGLHFAPDRAAAQELARTLCGHTPRLSD